MRVTKHMHAGGHFTGWATQPGATRGAIMRQLSEHMPDWKLVALSPKPGGVTFRETARSKRLVRVTMPAHLVGPQSRGMHEERALAVLALLKEAAQ